jgi:protocatechuate 3,4-dioxygenase, alpha subunit
VAPGTDTKPVIPTPSQTAGPFVSIGTEWDATGFVVPEGTPGALSIVGRVTDGAGTPVTDAMLEFWQAGPSGGFAPGPSSAPEPAGRARQAGSAGRAQQAGRARRAGPAGPGTASGSPGSWTGFARAFTDEQGDYRLVTLKPGPVPGPEGERQAPHIDVSIFARGLLQRLVTRIYFPDEEGLNATDPVLSSLRDPSLASRLVALPEPGRATLRFDIHLQGDQETVFFAPW